jgi:hypothetical protein
MWNPTFIKVSRLPVSGKYLYYRLFTRKVVELEPTEILIPLVIIDTRYEFLSLPQFQEFAAILKDKGIPLYIVCDFDLNLDLSVTASFPHIFMFDLDLPPSEYLLIKEAARRFLCNLPHEEVYHLPRYLSFTYTEMKINDANVDEAIFVLDLRKERFCSCPLIASYANSLGQFKRIIGCPDNLKSQIQKILPNPILLCGNERNLRDLILYWLDDTQMKEIL